MSVPAGWYEDPHDPAKVRWWDGTQWTGHAGGKPAQATAQNGGLRADIGDAKNRAGITFGGNREIKKLESHLWEGERVEHLATGRYGGGEGLVALTERRLFFLKDGVMKQTSEDFPFTKISSVQWDSGMMFGTIIVFVSSNRATIDRVIKGVGRQMVDTIRARISGGEAKPAPAPASTPAAPDVMGQLKQLGELRDAGVVTPEEFETKKADLLKRL